MSGRLAEHQGRRDSQDRRLELGSRQRAWSRRAALSPQLMTPCGLMRGHAP